jgi:hypothetical protein
MKDMTTVTLLLGKFDAGAAPPHYPLVLTWREGEALRSVEEKLTAPRDFSTYRNTFVSQAEETTELTAIGLHLHGLLHHGAVGEKLEELRQGLGAAGGLRVLLDVSDPELARLPWELIYGGGARRPFQDMKNTFVRVWHYDEGGRGEQAEPLNWPLRILIVVGVNEQQAKKIGAQQEIDRIEEALRPVKWLVDVQVCEQATLDELERVCREFKPHVFHYIGHGGVRQTDLGGVTRKDSYVVLQNDDGKDVTWMPGQITTSLAVWGYRPRLAFVNACRSANASTLEDQTTSWDVGDAFRDLGVPAVLTMQADVDGPPAGEFAGMLYERLAGGEPVDRALAAARVRMRDTTLAMNKDEKRDWATPTLTLSIPPESVLPLFSGINARPPQEVSCERFDEVRVFAGRRSDRRKFIYSIYPIPPGTPDKELIFVLGGKQMGKTWLTLSCLESYALKGHDVRFVELATGSSPKWLDVLMRIQTGGTDSTKFIAGKVPLIFRPLHPRAFDEFNHQLPYRLRNETPSDWGGQPVPAPDQPDTSNLDNLPPATVEEIFKSFRKALVRAAAPNNPLIIVLDKFSDTDGLLTETHMNNFIVPHLVEKAAGGDLVSHGEDGTRSVKLALVINKDEWSGYHRNRPRPSLNDLMKYAHIVQLEGIPAKDYDKVANEFFRNLIAGPLKGRPVPEDKIQEAFKIARPRTDGPWTPDLLVYLRMAFEIAANT